MTRWRSGRALGDTAVQAPGSGAGSKDMAKRRWGARASVAAGVRRGGLAALVWACSAAAMAQAPAGACDAVGASVKAPYSVACAARSACLSTDQLDIKPTDPSALPLTSVCLQIGPRQQPATLTLEAQDPAASAAATLSYALAPRLRDRAQGTALGQVLRAEPRGVLPVRVVMVDSKGRRFPAEFELDVAPMWTSGALPLAIGKAGCGELPCGLRSRVTVQVPDLGPWKNAVKVDATRLQLMLDGTRLAGMTPDVVTTPGAGSLSFQLPPATTTPEAQAAWAAVLRRALGADAPVRVAVADDKGAVAEADATLRFDLPTRDQRLGAAVLFAFGLAVVVAAAGRQSRWRFLRDDDGVPDAVVPLAERSFSLARCQMLWWTGVVLVSLFTIGHATGNWLAIDESALVLMGVSLATGAGAMAVRPARVDTLLKAWEAARTAPATAVQAQALADAESALRALPLRSGGLWKDLMSDFDQGVGLHRMQSLLFTLGFGLVYVAQTFGAGLLPSLPATALALMGISGGAYVGFKFAAR